MFVLKANVELKNTYTRLIESTKSRVDWTGLIIVNNDSLILLGKEKSLVFSMERKSVFGDIIEKDIDESSAYIVRSSQKNIISFLNIPLYVLGKWGALKGLVVNHNYEKLNSMFDDIVGQVKVEAKMTKDNIRFYKRGIRYDYEDVLTELIKNEQRLATGEEEEDEHNEYKMGLWRKIKWISDKKQFDKITTYQKVESSDIGKNFFSVTFKCPYCKDKLYMVLFDKNREYLIETDEQRVYLARAYTCTNCHSMFTPKPDKLLSEGDIFKLDFEDDVVAYLDYASLLSDAGSRENNYNFNRYEFAKPQRKEKHLTDYEKAGYTKAQIDEMIEEGFFEEDEVADRKLNVQAKSKVSIKNVFKNPFKSQKDKDTSLSEEDNDYDENISEENSNEIASNKENANKSVKKKKVKVNNETNERITDDEEIQQDVEHEKTKKVEKEKNTSKKRCTENTEDDENSNEDMSNAENDDNEDSITNITAKKGKRKIKKKQDIEVDTEYYADDNEDDTKIELKIAKKKNIKKIITKKNAKNKLVSDTEDVSDNEETKRIKIVKKYVEAEENIAEDTDDVEVKENIIEDAEYEETDTEYPLPEDEDDIKELVKDAKDTDFDNTIKIIEVIDKSRVSATKKQPFIDALKKMATIKAKKEIATKIKKDSDTKTAHNVKILKNTVQKYKDYAPELVEKIDNTSAKLDEVETKNIKKIIKTQADDDRESLINLRKKLLSKGFDEDNVKPYIDRIDGVIEKKDKKEIDKICSNVEDMSYADVVDAYEKIAEGIFLPELKNNALMMLDKRLSMIKINESTLLVKKLKKMIESEIDDTSRMYYCNVVKMALEREEATNSELALELYSELEEEMQENKESDVRSDIIINNALKTYGFINNKYEYPIVVLDSSLNGTGKSGVIITDEHIFYKNIVNPGSVKIENVASISLENKMYGKAILLILKNGEIAKLPTKYCAKNLEDMVKILTEFVEYLKEKPKSRDLKYMAKKEHKVKCCYRCGYTFTNGNVCPKCGNVQK